MFLEGESPTLRPHNQIFGGTQYQTMCNPAIKSQKDKKSWQKAKACLVKRILSAEKHDSNRKIIKVQQCAKNEVFH